MWLSGYVTVLLSCVAVNLSFCQALKLWCGYVAVILCCFHLYMHGCNYCVELTVLSGYMYIDVSVFVLSIPDRNRHVSDQSIPSDFPVPATVPGHIMQEREWLWCFPDRFQP